MGQEKIKIINPTNGAGEHLFYEEQYIIDTDVEGTLVYGFNSGTKVIEETNS